MALANPYEVVIPSDSEDEDDYTEAVWIEEPEETPGRCSFVLKPLPSSNSVPLLIITNGVLPKKAMEAAVNQSTVTRSPFAKLR